MFYTLCGVPIAWFADRSHRVRIIAAACACWSLFSAASGLAGSFLQLAVARMGVGVGEAGGTTPSYAVISDYFPPAERGRALALFSLGVPFGIAIGAALGGGVAAAYGWRAAFYTVGLPGVAIALLILLVVREPIRGIQDGAAGRVQAAPLGEVLRLFFGNPVLIWTAIAAGLGAFAGYGSANWTPAFLMRHQHMSLGQLAAYYSVSVGVAVGAGTWLSGYLADRLSRRDPRAYAMIPFWGSLIALPFAIAGYLATSWQVSLACLTVSGGFGILYLAPALAIVQNTVPPQARSTSAALLLLILNLIGLGGGPVFVGLMSDLLKPHFAGDSLQMALLCSAPVFAAGYGGLPDGGARDWQTRQGLLFCKKEAKKLLLCAVAPGCVVRASLLGSCVDPCQHGSQCFQFRCGEAAEQARFQLQRFRHHVRIQNAARFGEHEPVRAAIAAVRLARYQAAFCKRHRGAADRHLVHAGAQPDRLLGDAVMLGDHRDEAPFGYAEAEQRLIRPCDGRADEVRRDGQPVGQERFQP